MRRRLHTILSSRYPALSWTLIIFILLALPGKMLPSEEHLEIPQLDKLVHLVLFGGFVFLWSFYYASKQEENKSGHPRYLLIFTIACLFGTAMEFVQKYFIPNRDFDIYDIAADIAGALIGFLIVRFIIARVGKG